MSTLTRDTLYNGRLICHQHKDGYRFSVDAILAAHFCSPKPDDTVLDLCCGCGVIGLILCHRFPELTVCGLELQPPLGRLARMNVDSNTFNDRFSIQEGDLRRIREIRKPEEFDLVICNPPYRRVLSGRVNTYKEAAIARHELTASLREVVRAAAYCVKNRKEVVFVYPATRAGSLISELTAARLIPKRIQPVYSYPGCETASLVLVEAVKNGGEQSNILAPFYIYAEKNGEYSEEMQFAYG